MVEWKDFDYMEIQEIFEKIDEIENIERIDEILPKDYRITIKEYADSIQNPDNRKTSLAKINNALNHIYNSINTNQFAGLDLYAGFMVLLNKNLVKVQENTIDIKRWLEKEQD